MTRTLAGSNPRQDYCRYDGDKKQDRRELVVMWHWLYLLKNAGPLSAKPGRPSSIAGVRVENLIRAATGEFRLKADFAERKLWLESLIRQDHNIDTAIFVSKNYCD